MSVLHRLQGEALWERGQAGNAGLLMRRDVCWDQAASEKTGAGEQLPSSQHQHLQRGFLSAGRSAAEIKPKTSQTQQLHSLKFTLRG